MSAGYTNLRTVSYRDTIAELIARANQTHTRATGVQVFSPGDGMAYEDSEGFINPISPALFDDAKGQIAEASEAIVAAEAELEAAQGRIDETTELLGQLDEQAAASAEQVAGVVKDMEADRARLTAAQADLDALKPRLGDVEGAVSASDAKASQAISDAARALQEAQQAREYAEGLDPSTGDGSYSEAMQAAQQAARDALASMERANQAFTSASGKASVRNATSSPQGVGTAVGDTWFQWTAFPGGTVTGQWTWDGTEWRPVTLSHQVLSSVDLGKATVGELEGGRIKAHTLEANRLTVGVGQNAIVDPMFSSVDLTNRRMSESVGAWTQNRAGALPFVESTGTSSVSFRYAGVLASNAIPTVAGQKWRIQVPVNPGGGQARVNVRWFNAAGISSYTSASSYVTGTEDTSISTIWEAPATAVGFLVDVYSPAPSASRTVRVYAGISVQSMTGTVHIEDGAITAPKVNAREVAGAIGSFVNVKAENVEVTEALAARVFSATTSTVAEQFVTDRMVIGTGTDATVLEVLGTAVVNDLNIRGTLRGRDAILDGTLDVEQLNVTEDMAAKIVSAMTVNTKKLIVTESAVMQHVTAIEGIVTPKITASEARMGELIAEKASIADIEAGNLTLTGTFRSASTGRPSVVIPQAQTVLNNREQLAVWITNDGVIPLKGGDNGAAGIWIDSQNNKNESWAKPLHLRGQLGGGTNHWGTAQFSNTQGGGTIYGRSGLNVSTNGLLELVAVKSVDIKADVDIWLKSSDTIRFARPDNSPYINSITSNNLRTVSMGASSGTIYTNTSSRRFKVDIETAKPDHEWLDMRTVTYLDRIAVELKAEIEARRATGDCTPLTAGEHERLAVADLRIPGRIAEEGVGVADAQVVLDGSGQVESWDYSRDAVMLTPHVREHRDKIADLEARIAELESALL